MGKVLRLGPQWFEPGQEPEWFRDAEPVIAAMGRIERLGLEGWLRWEGLDAVPHSIRLGLDVLWAELDRLDLEARVREAERERSRRDAAPRR